MHTIIFPLLVAFVPPHSLPLRCLSRGSTPPSITLLEEEATPQTIAAVETAVAPTPAASTESDDDENWTAADTAINAGLFFLLHTTVWSSTQFIGFSPTDSHDRWAFAVARLVSISAFVGLQQAAPGGISLNEWPLLPSSAATESEDDKRNANPLLANPILAGVGFAGASVLASGALAAVSQGSLDASVAAELAWLPSPKPLEPGRVLDLLVSAPLQEELIFRGWLLAALRRNGVNDVLALMVSALLFTVWHIDAINGNAFLRGGDGGGLVQLFALGTWLGVLYNNASRKSLLLPIATHSAYNGLILLLEAIRA